MNRGRFPVHTDYCAIMVVRIINNYIQRYIKNDCRGAYRQSLDKAIYRAATRYERSLQEVNTYHLCCN